MIELTKIFVERLLPADAIKAAFSHLHRKQLAELGVDVFQGYDAINRVYVTARQIIESLDRTVQKYDAAQAEGRSVSLGHEYDAVFTLTARQVRLLPAAARRFAALDKHLHLLDREAHAVIGKFLEGKYSLFEALRVVLTSGDDRRLDGARAGLVLVGERDWSQAAQRRRGHDGNDWRRGGPSEEERALWASMERELQALGDKLAAAQVQASLHADIVSMFRRYLERGTGETLSTVEASMAELYAAIKANFSVEDLLMKVGDRRSIDVD